MSEYMVCKGEFDELDTLKEALSECGNVRESAIEVHSSPVVLNGYNRGDTKSKAEVVIRSGNAGNTYDIGFFQKEGVYVPIMNDLDVRSKVGKAVRDGDLIQTYAKIKILREVKKRRCKVVEQRMTDEGKVRIVLSS